MEDLARLSYTRRCISLTELDRLPMNLCTSMNEEGEDGESPVSELSLMSYTLRSQRYLYCHTHFWEPKEWIIHLRPFKPFQTIFKQVLDEKELVISDLKASVSGVDILRELLSCLS